MADIIDYFDYTRGPECLCQVRDRDRARRLKWIRRKNAWLQRVEFITGRRTVDAAEIKALLSESDGPDRTETDWDGQKRTGTDRNGQKRTGAAAPVLAFGLTFTLSMFFRLMRL